MISLLPQNFPLLRVGRRHLVPLERRWMVQELQRAADRAGQPRWWPAEQVAEGVSLWLRRDLEEDAVALDELQARLGRALEGIGEGGIASRLALAPPPLRLDLLELARSGEVAWELDFFRLLALRLESLLADGFQAVAIENLDAAVDEFCPRGRMTRAWRELRCETEQFLARTLERAA